MSDDSVHTTNGATPDRHRRRTSLRGRFSRVRRPRRLARRSTSTPPPRRSSAACSGLVAPAITEATVGWASSQAMASSVTVWPWSAAYDVYASTRSNASSVACLPNRSLLPAKRVPAGNSSPRTYLPVSIPDARGKYGTTPSPWRSTAGTTSSSTSRRSRLHSICVPQNAARCCSAETPAASSICAAATFELARWSTLPARTSSSSASSASLDRTLGVGVVLVVEVDPVGAQPGEAALDRLADPRRERARRIRLAGRPGQELGGDDHLVAPRPERRAEELLRLPLAVHLGRVEVGDPGVERGVDNGGRGGGIEAPAEVVAAEADHRQVRAGRTELAGLHPADHCSAAAHPTFVSRRWPTETSLRTATRAGCTGGSPSSA